MIEDLGAEEGLEVYKKSNKIALIDADTIIFAAAVIQEYSEDLLPKELYSDGEWQEIIEHPNYDEAEGCIWHTDEEKLYEVCVGRIREIQYVTNTKDVELYFTSGKNFRYEVDPMYKANRKNNHYPMGIAMTRDRLLKEFNGTICTTYEADDMVVMLKRTQPEKYVLCACDKDVYLSVPGTHFNYYRSELHNIPMKWIEIEAKDAYQFPYIQTLMGDTTDNIRGCPGIGKVKAAKAIAGLVTPEDMWKAVVKLFRSKKLTVKDAIRDMRLVNMHQLSINGEIVLWQPPCNLETIK